MPKLTEGEQILLATKMNGIKKSPAVGVVLAFFLGGLGAHKFYMQKYVQGCFYAAFSWTFIPACIAFVEMFMKPSRVRRFNKIQEQEIIRKIVGPQYIGETVSY